MTSPKVGDKLYWVTFPAAEDGSDVIFYMTPMLHSGTVSEVRDGSSFKIDTMWHYGELNSAFFYTEEGALLGAIQRISKYKELCMNWITELLKELQDD